MNINKVEKGFEQSLIDDKRKPLTVDGYLRNIRDFHKRLGIETLEDLQNISLDELKGYFDFQTDNYAPTTVNNRIATLKVYYKYLMLNRLVSENLVQYKQKVIVPEPEPQFLEKEDVIQLLDVAKQLKAEREEFGTRDLLVIQICLNCGLRIFEVRKLKISDFNFQKCCVTFVGKKDIKRTVYLGAQTMQTLYEWLEQRSKINIKEGHEDYLFISKFKTQISKRRLQQIVEEYVKRAEVKKVSSHKLRHTFATMMIGENNCSTEELQDMLGHKHRTTTEIYRHALQEGLKKSQNLSFFA